MLLVLQLMYNFWILLFIYRAAGFVFVNDMFCSTLFIIINFCVNNDNIECTNRIITLYSDFAEMK